MRRRDREMTTDFAYELIDKAAYGILSLCDENSPYAVPLSIVRKEDTLYFHCAKSGRKLDILEKNNRVIVTFVGEVNVPEYYSNEELDQMETNNPKLHARLLSKVFTTLFESAIIKGTCMELTDDTEKIEALRLISEKYVPDKMKYFDAAIKHSLSITKCFAITIEEITAKKK